MRLRLLGPSQRLFLTGWTRSVWGSRSTPVPHPAPTSRKRRPGPYPHSNVTESPLPREPQDPALQAAWGRDTGPWGEPLMPASPHTPRSRSPAGRQLWDCHDLSQRALSALEQNRSHETCSKQGSETAFRVLTATGGPAAGQGGPSRPGRSRAGGQQSAAETDRAPRHPTPAPRSGRQKPASRWQRLKITSKCK